MPAPDTVILYVTPTWPYCTLVREFLSLHDVEYEEKDVAADVQAREEMLALTGRLAVPVLQVGQEAVVGFDKERISALLGL